MIAEKSRVSSPDEARLAPEQGRGFKRFAWTVPAEPHTIPCGRLWLCCRLWPCPLLETRKQAQRDVCRDSYGTGCGALGRAGAHRVGTRVRPCMPRLLYASCREGGYGLPKSGPAVGGGHLFGELRPTGSEAQYLELPRCPVASFTNLTSLTTVCPSHRPQGPPLGIQTRAGAPFLA